MSREQFDWEIEQIEHGFHDDQDEDQLEAQAQEEEALLTRLKKSGGELSEDERKMLGIVTTLEWKLGVALDQAAIARSQRADAVKPVAEPTAPTQRPTSNRLMTIVDRWAVEQKPTPRTVGRTRKIVEWFEALNGPLPIESIHKQHVLAFKDWLLKEDKTPANINVIIPMLGTIFIYAIDKLHLIQINPAAKIRVTDKRRAKEKRRAFELAELQAIFNSPVYSKDRRPDAGGGEAAYWLPLLPLYTGARQTELGQLHPDDVTAEAYHDAQDQAQTAWVMRIVENSDRGQRVKNEGSERRIPIHSDLVTLGFLDVVREAKAGGSERIFPNIVPNAGGELMGNWSKWFGRYRRKECGLASPDTPFHSFRHAFKHYARLASIPNEVHNEITGHETGDVADAYGGMSYPLLPLVEGMKRYRVPGLVLPLPPPQLR